MEIYTLRSIRASADKYIYVQREKGRERERDSKVLSPKAGLSVGSEPEKVEDNLCLLNDSFEIDPGGHNNAA